MSFGVNSPSRMYSSNEADMYGIRVNSPSRISSSNEADRYGIRDDTTCSNFVEVMIFCVEGTMTEDTQKMLQGELNVVTMICG